MGGCSEFSLAGWGASRKLIRSRCRDLRRRCPNSVIGAELDQLLEEMSHGGM